MRDLGSKIITKTFADLPNLIGHICQRPFLHFPQIDQGFTHRSVLPHFPLDFKHQCLKYFIAFLARPREYQSHEQNFEEVKFVKNNVCDIVLMTFFVYFEKNWDFVAAYLLTITLVSFPESLLKHKEERKT